MQPFKTMRICSSEIEVLDVPTGHVFTFRVGEDAADPTKRVLSPSGKVIVNLQSRHSERSVPKTIHSFAEREMLARGWIDRLLTL